MKSFISVLNHSDFSIYNLPWGIFSTQNLSPRPGMALGNQIIHLEAMAKAGLLKNFEGEWLISPTLNLIMGQGPGFWKGLRKRVQHLFLEENRSLWGNTDPGNCLIAMKEATLHLPVEIGDYTDFYSSEYHAANVGSMFRDPQNPLLPNWKHLPVGYHGRSSSIVVSGTPFHRPLGQMKPADATVPVFGPSRQMDLELETGFLIGKSTKMGETIPVDQAEDWMFGMVLFNDWSARDLQSWEYVPLGPFLGKNFCSSMSPWVVSFDALEPFKEENQVVQDPVVLPYLSQKTRWTYDIQLEAEMVLSTGQRKIISKTNQKYLYWTMNQQLTHHTINGCPMRVGDLLASGTISGPSPDSLGCLLEITRRGQNPVVFEDGTKRNFMEDGDSLVLRGFGQKSEIRVGFGEVEGTLLPAIAYDSSKN